MTVKELNAKCYNDHGIYLPTGSDDAIKLGQEIAAATEFLVTARRAMDEAHDKGDSFIASQMRDVFRDAYSHFIGLTVKVIKYA
jgi:hypothetical protein